ncbi:endo-1,4-beta-xylanase [Paenibacillus kobensis]|uniref:endo-1,4-beta-xylanase n=1 Tax=Paenibacillus kobensis TaxID=59841 RepID=UPI001580D368|nr:endo-1,4-beta-xylanase [Paenibacillus kobensis]
MKKLGMIALSALIALAIIVPPKSATPVASADTVKVTNGFEDGTLQGWGPRLGTETVTVVGAAGARTGSQGMFVDTRTQNYHGASKDLTSLLNLGINYTVRGWVKLPNGSGNTNVTMSMQRTEGTTTNYENLATQSVTSNGWVKLEASYRLSAVPDAISVYFESSSATQSFYVDDFEVVEITPPAIETSIPSLKTVFANDFPIGTAILNDEMFGPNGDLLTKHFASITPGNNLKWDATEPVENEFHFDGPDAVIQFAQDHNMKVRGHTLVWHSQAPDWIFRDANGNLVSKTVLYARLKNHIDTVVGRYKGKIYAWDVANEVIDESQPNGMRNSLWYQIAGEEYIEKAFEYAHAADPNAKLYINDYNTHIPQKAQFLYDLVKRLKAKGVPIDGVGHQTHINIEYPQLSQIEDSIVKFSDLGVLQDITELDMSIYNNNGTKYDTLSTTLAQQQATRYKALFDIFVKHKDLLSNVIFWGQDDGHTWLRTYPTTRNDWPLLFNEQLQSKPAFWSLVGNPNAVPAAPTGLTATAGNGSVSLAWTASTGATSYNVKRAATSGGTYTTVATGVTGTTYTNTSLTNGTTYYYVVTAVNATGESTASTQASATPTAGVSVPAVPTGVTATAGNGSVTLAWTASSGATSYNVKRATTSGGPYTTVATAVTGTTYTNSSLTNGTTYYYVVTAVNSAGESTSSAQASATPAAVVTVPAAPTGVTATAGNGSVTLAWTASSGATSYNVKRATTSGGPYTTAATAITGTTYTNSSLTNGTTYYYVVTAVNSAGESTASAQASATPTGGTTTTSSLVLQYRAGDTNVNDNAIKPFFNIKNTGTTPVNLSGLKIRYYFTKDSSAALNSWVDYAVVGGANISRTFGTASATGADTYIELSFSASAGVIQPGGQSGEIQLRISKSDWSNFSEANDYSFDATKNTAFADWNKITLYQDGVKVWGLEP